MAGFEISRRGLSIAFLLRPAASAETARFRDGDAQEA
jgi:hypothetical protein